MKTNRSVRMVGSALAAVAMMGATQATAATTQVSGKQTLAVANTEAQVRRSYKRRLQLTGGTFRMGKTPFVTKGNRAQRARQLAGMMCLN